MMVYQQNPQGLLIWEYRFPPEEVRRHCEAEIHRCKLQLQAYRVAKASLETVDSPEDILANIEDGVQIFTDRLLRHARELFVINNPKCEYRHGPAGWAILSEDDEMTVRLTYL